MFGDEEGVHAAEAGEEGDDSDGLVLDANELGGDAEGEVEGDGVE